MAFSVSYFLVGLLVGWFVLYRFKRRESKSSTLPFPPGPSRLPILGNALNNPVMDPCSWKEYASLSEKFGDVLYLDILGSPVVVLSSAEAVHDLLEKRSAIYSDRPRSTMLHGLMDLDWALAFAPYGDRWRKTRRVFHQAFNTGTTSKFHEMQTDSARFFLRLLKDTPTDFFEHIRLVFTRSMMKITYDIDINDPHDPYVHMIYTALAGSVTASQPGTFLVNMLPILQYLPRWFPGTYFHKLATEAKSYFERVRDEPFRLVKDQMASGTARPSVVSSMLDKFGESQDVACRDAAAAACIAGANTTISAMQAFFLLMVHHPEVQAKAQAELDEVVGQDRLPTFSDQPFLPYVEAIVSEILRWHVVTPLAGPRYTYTEDEYRGYHIPKGSHVVGNAWAILRDPVQYPQPDQFIPERFLTPDGKPNRSVQDPDVACFGFGRRICPGRSLGRDSLFIQIASVLHAFSITSTLDPISGNPIPVDYALTTGFAVHPLPYQCTIKPRSSSTEALIL